jgi:hypothetical protein
MIGLYEGSMVNRLSANNANNNNTFTWSSPSGVLGCTGQGPVAPAADYRNAMMILKFREAKLH